MTNAPDADKRGQFQTERRFARRWALQFLYQVDQQDDWGVIDRKLGHLRAQVLEFEEDAPTDKAFDRTWCYVETLVRGVCEHRAEIDDAIGAAATNWTMDRMGVIDRGILRLATYELMFEDKVPGAAAINEAVELAKIYGDVDTSRFVNGVLDRIFRSLQPAEDETE
ncbi:MAG: transcription antitermination factor NusB [Lentisphaeria bacterium]|nr:transcription antitermination factor NusB [Lentisphaeria bacterium]